ncbi:AraC family transcriptional regulator [Anaerosporobacter faecicola]|uniref:AraC family transcriptional regulator n=1 Tax=Anaerosporobacter faecicola TaxID=2718714 RepID=UPI00143BA0B4|nr:AraC family transcriptional regulator [Anaerosporobacter faecicola]
MNYLEQLNQALQYIEEHLDSTIDKEELAKITGYSFAYFQRTFSLLTNITLGEYIRRRKMTRAAIDLRNGEERILDIALKYGYDSADSFTRAFQQLHGITPSLARREGSTIKSYPPMTFHISIQGDTSLNYRFEKVHTMRIVGVKKVFVAPQENEGSVDVFWNEVFSDGRYEQLCTLLMKEPKGVHGFMQVIDENTVEYTIGVVTDEKPPENMEVYEVPEANYAIFEAKGPIHKTMADLWSRIFREWLPTSGYRHAETVEIECFRNQGNRQAEDFQYEIWIPIKRIR